MYIVLLLFHLRLNRVMALLFSSSNNFFFCVRFSSLNFFLIRLVIRDLLFHVHTVMILMNPVNHDYLRYFLYLSSCYCLRSPIHVQTPPPHPSPVFEPPQGKVNVVWDAIYPMSTGKLLPTFRKGEVSSRSV